MPKYINKYYGVTQNPISKDYVIIMKYCEGGDLRHYLTKHFYNLEWSVKLYLLLQISIGLEYIHKKGIIHQDFHSGNILCYDDMEILIGDLGISKSLNELADDNDKIYGII